MVALVLILSKADGITEEGCGEGETIHPCGAGDLKIIFTLLTKVIAIHVRFFGIGFQGSSLEGALSRLC